MLLTDIIATEQLPARDPGVQLDAESICAPLTTLHARDPKLVWDAVTEQMCSLCDAESAGVSIFADFRHDELTWFSTAGKAAPFQGRRYPRRHSMCGVAFARGQTELFLRPHLYFQWMAQAGMTIREGLVVPLLSGGEIYGATWLMTHRRKKEFTLQDARVLELLGQAATGLIGAGTVKNQVAQITRPMVVKDDEARTHGVSLVWLPVTSG